MGFNVAFNSQSHISDEKVIKLDDLIYEQGRVCGVLCRKVFDLLCTGPGLKIRPRLEVC